MPPSCPRLESLRAGGIARPERAGRRIRKNPEPEPKPEKIVSEEKERLRAALLPALRAIAWERAEQEGRAIASQLDRWSEWACSPEVALFSSVPGEVDSAPILEVAQRAGMQILLPRMRTGSTLEFVPVEGFEDLVRGRYGVRQPGGEMRARPLQPDAIVLVPGVAFDRQGGRLGRGAGYYDRALARIARGPVRACFVVGGSCFWHHRCYCFKRPVNIWAN